MDDCLLFGCSKLLAVCAYVESKWSIVSAFREPALVNAECSSSSPIALKLSSVIDLESKLQSPFVLKQ